MNEVITTPTLEERAEALSKEAFSKERMEAKESIYQKTKKVNPTDKEIYMVILRKLRKEEAGQELLKKYELGKKRFLKRESMINQNLENWTYSKIIIVKKFMTKRLKKLKKQSKQLRKDFKIKQNDWVRIFHLQKH